MIHPPLVLPVLIYGARGSENSSSVHRIFCFVQVDQIWQNVIIWSTFQRPWKFFGDSCSQKSGNVLGYFCLKQFFTISP